MNSDGFSRPPVRADQIDINVIQRVPSYERCHVFRRTIVDFGMPKRVLDLSLNKRGWAFITVMLSCIDGYGCG